MRKSGVELIAEERIRQVAQEGYNNDVDDAYEEQELVSAALAYITGNDDYWPWNIESFKPSEDRVLELTKAGALIAAEIDKLQRVK